MQAHELEPTDLDVVLILCAATGDLVDDNCAEDKIKYCFEFLKYLSTARTLEARSYEFHHMRGRFAYQIAILGPEEKEVANTPQNLPNTRLHDAITDLLSVSLTKLLNEKLELLSREYISRYYIMKIHTDSEDLTIAIDPECVVERKYLEEATQIIKGENHVNYLDM
ncbi:hypothetical protein KIN20_006220 [Parelaphostrongylus tenuis]|uniref:Uncharacterized protein n=1 Tax=Parelaphostrongylus tenuis TaxID=148309 RepID=A0AAD5M1E8_PARTN|nr:hypothetical protein KIN20_006220 [Parelaphostrongylus tenuis]